MARLHLLTLVLALAVLLSGCGGGTVDADVPSFVDRDAPRTVDSISPPAPGSNSPTAEPVAINESHEDFQPPPNFVAENASLTLDEKKSFVGRDAVKLWVWNERGSQRLLIAEGTSASISTLKASVEVSVVSSAQGGSVLLLVNGHRLPVLREREEAGYGNTWVFVSDIFLNEAGEPIPE